MSQVIDEAVRALNERMDGGFEAGTAKFQIDGEGAVLIDESGARADDGAADVTLRADAATFQEILAGDLDPTSAFMSGRLQVEGDMGLAMALGAKLS